MHVDFASHDVEQVMAATPHECQQHRAGSPECKFFTWKGGTCFMKNSNEGSAHSEMFTVSGPKTCVQEQPKLPLALLVTMYHSDAASIREQEIYNAMAANVRNPWITEVHVLFQPQDPSKGCAALTASLMASNFGRTCLSNTWLQKVKCAQTDHQPTAGELIMYANANLAQLPGFLLSHANVVFDSTLGRVNLNILRQGYGFIMSVNSPRQSSSYAAVMNKDHQDNERCSLGAFGFSWDAYLLAAPIKGNLQLDFFMNRKGAENKMAWQFWKGAGIQIYNPCLHVNAFHWHGTAPAEGRPVGDGGLSVDHLWPCWDCPGVTPTTAKRDLCAKGRRMPFSTPQWQDNFWAPSSERHQLCCQTPRACDDKILSSVQSPGWSASSQRT
mmetsp:Transcript_71408/g.126142  ORF Transcript_71408/g.126142 Transcript_71408/m.126142 type:complete len:385 (+) Transcript_71408:242-1396(+)